MIKISSFEIEERNKKSVRRKGNIEKSGFNNAMNKYNQNLSQQSYGHNGQQKQKNDQHLYNSTSLFNNDLYNYDRSLENSEEKRLKSLINSKFDTRA